MARVSEEIVVGSDGNVFVAPTGTAAPTDTATALNAAFRQLGFTSEDGVTLSKSRDIEDIEVWQSRYPARKVVTGETFGVGFVMRQWNRQTVELGLDATVSGTTGDYTITPNDPENIDERSVVVEWADGTDNFRLYIPRAFMSENGDIQITKGQAVDLPVTLEALASDASDPWLLFTDATAAFSGT